MSARKGKRGRVRRGVRKVRRAVPIVALPVAAVLGTRKGGIRSAYDAGFLKGANVIFGRHGGGG
jgi:hypothetical protein